MMGSDREYIHDEVKKAREANAPEDAIYYSRGSSGELSAGWRTFKDVTNTETRSIIENILKRSEFAND